MYPYLYRAYIESFAEDGLVEVVIDLGFHVATRRQVAAPPGPARKELLDRWIRALVVEGDDGAEPQILLLTGADGEPKLPPRGGGPPELWRYPAQITNIVDADTVDAEIDVGFDIVVRQRLRFAGIQVAEYGEPARLGFLTVFYQLKHNRNCAQIVSSRHGKWRRWLAEIYLEDADQSLNRELVEKGYAHPWDGRSPHTAGISRMLVELSDPTRKRLNQASATEGIAPGPLAGRIVTKYFEE